MAAESAFEMNVVVVVPYRHDECAEIVERAAVAVIEDDER